MVGVGVADSGNPRPLHDRLQVTLDSVATAMTRYHIDPERVYVTGMSGGGRCAALLWCCFPDVFTGGIPIVGVNGYRDIPAGPGKVYPASHSRPKGEMLALLRTRRLAPITGPPDFNHEHTLACVRVFERDRLDVRVFSYDDMAHEMPTPERFKEALGWVDEPWQERHAASLESARAKLTKVRSLRENGALDDEELEDELLEIIREAPWTEPAWNALEMLGQRVD